MTDTAFALAERYYDNVLKGPLRQVTFARRLIPKVTPLPAGKMEIAYQKIVEMSGAQTAYDLKGANIARDMIRFTDSSIVLPYIFKGWEISVRQMNAFQSEGIDLPTATGISAAQVIAEAEDTMLIQGWAPDGSTYKVSGLYQSAGNTDAGTDFATYGYASDSVATVLGKIMDDKIKGVNFNLTLNTVQYQQLVKSRNGTTGEKEMPDVLALLNATPGAAPGAIYWSADIVAGTGLITPVDTQGLFMDLVVGSDPRTVIGRDSKLGEWSPYYATLAEYVVPRIFEANAIGTLTAI